MIEAALHAAGFSPIVGIDEAGRGSCAGPITIAACILPPALPAELVGLDDSKKLTPLRRARLFPLIKELALSWSIVHISATDIDRFGIQHANISGMRRAVAQLGLTANYALIDGFGVPGLRQPQLPIIGGDGFARCVSAASILAKHARDELMIDYAAQYPGYAFEKHKGYGTKVHLDAVRRQGASPIHRYSYANVALAHGQWLSEKEHR
ncbi:Ribonuclease HII [Corynebacterium kalinowskii]|uniref:Ribonuclease HII n=1 Tax=Corynebacterium kalinowskii TaxID=2675216 RepID=A0A6B8VU61_9CORY|nr:ribonuclease HII [Corynebacterium kalinowskii]QGU02296.1 Ribonuclease HII [Corynebacterium kalinowskii]